MSEAEQNLDNFPLLSRPCIVSQCVILLDSSLAVEEKIEKYREIGRKRGKGSEAPVLVWG